MATSKVSVTEGAGKNMATHSFSEDAVTKEVQRVNLNDSAGVEQPIGAATEAAPASDTASSGLNGRLQRIAQRITSLIALLPTSLGTKTAANSLAATLASDDPAVVALQIIDDWDSNDAAKVVGIVDVVSANFNRPADTTTYATGDLIANNTAAGSVTPMTLAVARASGGTGIIRKLRLKKSTTSITNTLFRVHLYNATPTVTNGDNAAWLSIESGYLGSFDVLMDRAFSDAAKGFGVCSFGTEISFKTSGSANIYALIEARAGYAPGNGETFTVELEVWQN